MTESEWKTRKTRIDAQLKALRPAWDIIRFKEGMNTSILSHHAVEEYPTANGPADYALFVKGKLLGIIEAKKTAAQLSGKPYTGIIGPEYRWEVWAVPKGKDGKLDHHKALTGDDLKEFGDHKHWLKEEN